MSTVLTRVQQSESARYRRNKWISRVAPGEAKRKSVEPNEQAKGNKQTMKKLMIVAAAVAMAVTAEARIALTNCTQQVSSVCPVVAFKVTASGKTVSDNGDYKKVSKLKISKGALVLFSEGKTEDACCYDIYSLYLQVKVNKETWDLAILSQPLLKWSVFGKNLDKAMSATKSKKFALESDLGLNYDGDTNDDEDLYDVIEDLVFEATAFGSAKYVYNTKTTKATDCIPCNTTTTEDVVPGSYSGWFAGYMPKVSDNDACMTCACADADLFGGTWKAKYQSKWSVKNGWQDAASFVFGGAVARAMAAAEIE